MARSRAALDRRPSPSTTRSSSRLVAEEALDDGEGGGRVTPCGGPRPGLVRRIGDRGPPRARPRARARLLSGADGGGGFGVLLVIGVAMAAFFFFLPLRVPPPRRRPGADAASAFGRRCQVGGRALVLWPFPESAASRGLRLAHLLPLVGDPLAAPGWSPLIFAREPAEPAVSHGGGWSLPCASLSACLLVGLRSPPSGCCLDTQTRVETDITKLVHRASPRCRT